MARDYYEVLGVDRNASADELKRAYRRLARKYHPDVSKAEDAEARFKELQEAHEVLKDPEKRAAYDQFGEHWEQAAHYQNAPGGQGGFGSASFQTGAGGFADIFEEFFGSRPGGRRAPLDLDVHARIELTLEEAYRGGMRALTLQGEGGARTLKVKVPEGVVSGQKIRLRGQGAEHDGRKGDLYLTVDVLPHARFRLEGRDVHLRVPVAPWEAVLGRKIRVPTLGGPLEVSVPAGSSSGRKLRLKGRGLPGNPPGDQIIELEIVVPREVPDEARRLYEALEQVSSFSAREQMENE